MTERDRLERLRALLPLHSKKVYDADLFLCPRNVDDLRRIIDSIADYDCFFVNRDPAFDGCSSELVRQIGVQKSDWIEVFGYNAEKIHDAIDDASVDSGRQPSVGFGVPMTSWNDYESDQEIVDYLRTGGHGVSSTKLLIFVGTEGEETRFWSLIDNVDP